MPLDFPTSPAVNEIYTYGGRSWQWNGTAWDSYNPNAEEVVDSVNGITGAITISGSSGTGITNFGKTITVSNTGVLSINGSTGAVTNIPQLNTINSWSNANYFGGSTFTAQGDVIFLNGIKTESIIPRKIPAFPLTYEVSIGDDTSSVFIGGLANNTNIRVSDTLSSIDLTSPNGIIRLNSSYGDIKIGDIDNAQGALIELSPSDDLTNVIYIRPTQFGGYPYITITPEQCDFSSLMLTGQLVSSFNGSTGAIVGVSSVRGLTGAVGITNGSGIDLSVSGQTMTFSNTGVLSFNGLTGDITGVTTGSANTFGPLQSFTNGISAAGATLAGSVNILGGFTAGANPGNCAMSFSPLSSANNGGLWIRNGNLQLAGSAFSSGSGAFTYSPNSEVFNVYGQQYINQSFNYQAARVPLRLNAAPTQSVPIFAVYKQTVEGTAITAAYSATNMVAGINENGVLFSTTGISTAGGTYSSDISVNGARIGLGPGNCASNLVFGAGAYSSGTGFTGLNNLAIGLNSLASNRSGDSNIAIGRSALTSNVNGRANTAIGAFALASLSTNNWSSGQAEYNVAIGGSALTNSTTAAYNMAIGTSSLANNTTGVENVAIGTYALIKNNTGNDNVAIGHQALGAGAGSANPLTENVSIGWNSLYSTNTTSRNVAIGPEVGFSNTTGASNTLIGRRALYNGVTGSNTVAIGAQAGEFAGTTTSTLTNSNGSIFIGQLSRSANQTSTNEIVIGNNAVGLGSNTAVVGATSQTAATIYGLLNIPGGISAAGGVTFAANVQAASFTETSNTIRVTNNARSWFL